jgi:lipopolysaccharide transport protein LptA
MANSRSSVCVCALLATVLWSALAAQERGRSEDLVLDADALTFNRQTNLFEARRPRIVRGNIHIEGDESVGSGIDFEHASEWRFKGHVKIAVDATVLQADSAVFKFDQGQLAHADLEGGPASFTNRESNQEAPVHGGARKLVYDHVARTLRLSGDAQISKEKYAIQGCDLIYDFKVERWSSGSDDCGAEGFRVIVPQKPKPQTPPAAPPQ